MPSRPENIDLPTRPQGRPIVFVSQTFPPDPIAVGQYMADAAAALVERGHSVTAVTADRAYEDPSQRFSARELRCGVSVCRLPFSSLGKRTLLHRIVGQLSFCLQSILRVTFGKRPRAIVVTTSPPMGGAIGLLVSWLRNCPLIFWVMDINPDQAVAMKKVASGNPLSALLAWCNRWVLRHAAATITLDRFMAARLGAKTTMNRPPIVIPPWPLTGVPKAKPPEVSHFRAAQGWQGRFVVMFSGNHSPAHPLDTILHAARELETDERFLFAFVGGGIGKEGVQQAINDGARNIVSLPYQPFEQLEDTLAAADVHLVAMGTEMVGIVHPCKLYGAMAVGRPILLLGPENSHAGEAIQATACGRQVDHGDVAGAVAVLQALADLSPAARSDLGHRALQVVRQTYAPEVLSAKFCSAVEGTLHTSPQLSPA